MSGATLIVGVGSPHGDDQIGWRIAEALAVDSRPGWSIRTARNPAELLAWLDDKVEQLVICDACYGSASLGELHVWRWPTAEIQLACASGGHDLSLPSVLELAHELRRLPSCVVICAVEAKQHAPGAGLSFEVAAALPQVVSRIRGICDVADGDCPATAQLKAQPSVW